LSGDWLPAQLEASAFPDRAMLIPAGNVVDWEGAMEDEGEDKTVEDEDDDATLVENEGEDATEPYTCSSASPTFFVAVPTVLAVNRRFDVI